jgi:hypothetical protein
LPGRPNAPDEGGSNGERAERQAHRFPHHGHGRQSEVEEPWKAVEQAGGTPELISLKDGEIQAVQNDIEKGKEFRVDRTVEEADASQYDALVQPGGVGNPDRLRMDETAVHFVREFFQLIADLKEQDKDVVLASSAIRAHLESLLDTLQVRNSSTRGRRRTTSRRRSRTPTSSALRSARHGRGTR